MKKILLAMAVFAGVAVSCAAETAPIFSTTIDFLDYCCDIASVSPENAKLDYFPLEVYDACLKQMAECGIKKLNYRCNVTGLASYPSKLGWSYGYANGGHWGSAGAKVNSDRMANTLKRYDPMAETIRIGHKYGMEVWCWDSLSDDGATTYTVTCSDTVSKYGLYPLMDPYFRSRRECFSQVRPSLAVYDHVKAEAANRAAAGRTIAKIVFVSANGGNDGKPYRMTADNTILYVSDDNLTYLEYSGPKHIANEMREGGHQALIIDGLSIKAKYVKIGHRGFPGDNSFTMVLGSSDDPANQVFDTEGNLIPVTWGCDSVVGTPTGVTRKALFFNHHYTPSAVDFLDRAAGFALGCPVTLQDQDYRLGVIEYSVPEAMERKLTKFRELASYPFDGFIINNRTHTYVVPNPDDFGYNAETRAAYMEKYGQDIWAADFSDTAKLQELRADFIDAYIAGCKKLIGDRPLVMTMPEPREAGGAYPKQMWWDYMGSLPWHSAKWLRDGLVDGVRMIGWQNPEYFRPQLPADRKVTISRFIEMGFFGYPGMEAEKFRAELQQVCASPLLGEVELYETLLLSNRSDLREIVKEFATGQK